MSHHHEHDEIACAIRDGLSSVARAIDSLGRDKQCDQEIYDMLLERATSIELKLRVAAWAFAKLDAATTPTNPP